MIVHIENIFLDDVSDDKITSRHWFVEPIKKVGNKKSDAFHGLIKDVSDFHEK
jgi:hypothetical protein